MKKESVIKLFGFCKMQTKIYVEKSSLKTWEIQLSNKKGKNWFEPCHMNRFRSPKSISKGSNNVVKKYIKVETRPKRNGS